MPLDDLRHPDNSQAVEARDIIKRILAVGAHLGNEDKLLATADSLFKQGARDGDDSLTCLHRVPTELAIRRLREALAKHAIDFRNEPPHRTISSGFSDTVAVDILEGYPDEVLHIGALFDQRYDLKVSALTQVRSFLTTTIAAEKRFAAFRQDRDFALPHYLTTLIIANDPRLELTLLRQAAVLHARWIKTRSNAPDSFEPSSVAGVLAELRELIYYSEIQSEASDGPDYKTFTVDVPAADSLAFDNGDEVLLIDNVIRHIEPKPALYVDVCVAYNQAVASSGNVVPETITVKTASQVTPHN